MHHTDPDIIDVRGLVADALNHYADTRDTGPLPCGVTARDLARNVSGWTHATRVRDFITTTTIRKEAGQ